MCLMESDFPGFSITQVSTILLKGPGFEAQKERVRRRSLQVLSRVSSGSSRKSKPTHGPILLPRSRLLPQRTRPRTVETKEHGITGIIFFNGRVIRRFNQNIQALMSLLSPFAFCY
jgi:hypothetical protein